MDDAGEMSSWYVFAAMGFYPLSPADPEYLVTVPLFDEVRIKTGDGHGLTLLKQGNSRNLDAIIVVGVKQEGYFIPHALFGKVAPVAELGRASCRERMCQYGCIWVVAVSLT